MSWCAICAESRPPYVMRSLGKDDALVSVCRKCDEEHPRQGNYSFGDGVGAQIIPRLHGHKIARRMR